MGDARSRGYDGLIARLCAALRVRHVALETHSSALELLDALRAEHNALLGVVDGTRPLDDDNSEPTANSTKRRAVDPFGGGVRIGEASNEDPTPTPTPAAAHRPPLAPSPTPPALKRTASPRDARGSPTPPAPLKRALGNPSPTVFSSALPPAGAAAPAALPAPPAQRGVRAASPTPLFSARLDHAPRPSLVRPIAVRAGVPTLPAGATAHVARSRAPSAALPPVARSPAAPSAAVAASSDVRCRRRRRTCRQPLRRRVQVYAAAGRPALPHEHGSRRQWRRRC